MGDASSRRELCAQMAALFAMHDMPAGDAVMAHLEPLLSGTMDYAAHRAMLETMIHSLESREVEA